MATETGSVGRTPIGLAGSRSAVGRCASCRNDDPGAEWACRPSWPPGHGCGNASPPAESCDSCGGLAVRASRSANRRKTVSRRRRIGHAARGGLRARSGVTPGPARPPRRGWRECHALSGERRKPQPTPPRLSRSPPVLRLGILLRGCYLALRVGLGTFLICGWAPLSTSDVLGMGSRARERTYMFVRMTPHIVQKSTLVKWLVDPLRNWTVRIRPRVQSSSPGHDVPTGPPSVWDGWRA